MTRRRLLELALLPASLAACFAMRPSGGGGEAHVSGARVERAGDVSLPPGFRIELVASGLTFPTGVAFDDRGEPYVVEAGYSYGEVFGTPRVLRIARGRAPEVVATGANGPWNGVAFHAGKLYVAEGGELHGGKILEIDPRDGSVRAIVEGLPSMGDHHVDGPAIGPDGAIYFGIGTATNAGVVGRDDADFGWLRRNPRFHDVPCKDVTLTGANFEAEGTTTGAFVPYGTATERGQVVRGQVPCSSAILRVRPGGAPELVAWGFRNPFGLAFAPDGRLFVTDNQYDDRGSRPVFGSGDLLYAAKEGAWYGWPDYAGGRPLADGRFKPPKGPAPKPLIAAPAPPEKPVAIFGVHASADGFDFSRSDDFGYAGEAFVAEFGDQAPVVGKTPNPVGFKVVRVDVATGVVHDFAKNKGGDGPASRLGSGGLERPIAARFDPSGRGLYVVDFGVLTMDEKGSHPRSGTGALFRITRDPSTPPPAHLSPTRGEVLFMRLCNECHPGAGGGLGPSLGLGATLGAPAIRTQVRNGFGAMPKFSSAELSDFDLDQIIAYVQARKP